MTTEKNKSKNQIICIALFVIYAILTLIGAARHEIWFDEAQAWTIARDNTISGIFEQLRYEGHPPLWYMILYVFSHLGFSCNVIPFISWFFTGLAAAVVMFKSPFSTVTKALLVFSGGFLFFNSVMSRTYCLINLFLVLIAMLFQKRKEHPIIFGILVALLANTHVFVSGFIGAIGLIMLHDIYSDWKTNSTKKNVLNLTGLAIAGIGVLMLVIPLIGSLSANSSTNNNRYTLKGCLISFSESYYNISLSLVESFFFTPHFIAAFMSILFVAMLLLMRHKTRPMLILTLSNLFYIITSEILWLTIPNRAHILVLIFYVTIWISETEAENNASSIWNNFNLKIDTKLIKKLLEAIKKSDLNFNNSYRKILSVVLILAIPSGVLYLGADYIKMFSPGIAVAEFAKENLPSDAVLIYYNESQPQIAAYLPKYKFYSLNECGFCTYDTHKKNGKKDYEVIYNDLKDFQNLYLIKVNIDINAIESNYDIVYTVRENIPFGVNAAYIELSKIDLDELQ